MSTTNELSALAEVVAYETTVVSGDPAVVWAPTRGTNLPLVVLIHGSHTHPAMYTKYASIIASHGFVVIAPEHQRELFGDFAHYPQQAFINWAMKLADDENAREGSPIQGRVDTTRVLLSGHSMGGGAALGIASDFGQPGLVVDDWSMPNELVAVVVNGTHNIPPPRTGEPLPVSNKVPIAFMQGSVDDVVKLEQVERTFAVVEGVKPYLYVEIAGGNHFFLTDVDNPEGVNPDRHAMELDQETSVLSAATWTALWFLANLGDASALDLLRAGPDPEAEPHLSTTLIEP